MEQPDGATEANQRDEILRSFSAGGAYSKRRDLWLLVSARNSETRSRLRNDGILHLADVLQRDDFDAVECLAKVWRRSKVERESSSKATIRAGSKWVVSRSAKWGGSHLGGSSWNRPQEPNPGHLRDCWGCLGRFLGRLGHRTTAIVSTRGVGKSLEFRPGAPRDFFQVDRNARE